MGISYDYLLSLTDDTGVHQHAKGQIPWREHGYCSDDVCRALMVAVREARYSERLKNLEKLCISFLLHSVNPDTGFRNFMGYDRTWLEDLGSPDSQGRVVLALGLAYMHDPEGPHAPVCGEIFDTMLPKLDLAHAPRSLAYSLIGIAYRKSSAHDSLRRQMAGEIQELYRTHSSETWDWFEPRLTYANAVLSHAMILQPELELQAIGLRSLEWLWKHETDSRGLYSPTGNSAPSTPDFKPTFDQQPIEAGETSMACLAAWKITNDPKWIERQSVCAAWFEGANLSGTPLGDTQSGSCRDGFGAAGPSINCGAESTICYLLTTQDSRELASRHARAMKSEGVRSALR